MLFPALPPIEGDTVLEVFTHKSLNHPTASTDRFLVESVDNQRLAVLGKNILQGVVTTLLYNDRPLLHASSVLDVTALIMAPDNIAKWSKLYNLPAKLRHAPAVNPTTVRHSEEASVNVFYAYLGAVFTQRGMRVVQDWIDSLVRYAAYMQQRSSLDHRPSSATSSITTSSRQSTISPSSPTPIHSPALSSSNSPSGTVTLPSITHLGLTGVPPPPPYQHLSVPPLSPPPPPRHELKRPHSEIARPSSTSTGTGIGTGMSTAAAGPGTGTTTAITRHQLHTIMHTNTNISDQSSRPPHHHHDREISSPPLSSSSHSSDSPPSRSRSSNGVHHSHSHSGGSGSGSSSSYTSASSPTSPIPPKRQRSTEPIPSAHNSSLASSPSYPQHQYPYHQHQPHYDDHPPSSYKAIYPSSTSSSPSVSRRSSLNRRSSLTRRDRSHSASTSTSTSRSHPPQPPSTTTTTSSSSSTSSPLPLTTHDKGYVSLVNDHSTTHKYRIEYRYDSEGPPHSRRWTVTCLVDEEVRGQGSGATKQSAREDAAKKAYLNMNMDLDLDRS